MFAEVQAVLARGTHALSTCDEDDDGDADAHGTCDSSGHYGLLVLVLASTMTKLVVSLQRDWATWCRTLDHDGIPAQSLAVSDLRCSDDEHTDTLTLVAKY